MVNPESFPQVDLSRLDCSRYFYKTNFAEKTVALFASHGCPFHCGFCSVHQVYGRRWFPRRAENVLREMAHLKEKYGIGGVTFNDDNFFIDKKYTVKLLEGMIASGLGLKWAANAHSSTFLKIADAPFLDLLKRSGCRQILIGAETGNTEILEKIIAKHAIVEETYDFVALLARQGITPILSTMVGFPYGDGKDYIDTVNMIVRCKKISPLMRSMIFFYTPYPGTDLYSYSIEHGFKPPATLEEWGGYSLTGFRAPWVSDEARRFIRNFNCFYLYYLDINAVFYNRNPLKIFLKLILHTVADLRFRFNFFRFQADAELVYWLLKMADKLKLVDMASLPWADFR
jgi:radical SAM superfamily enzyme YgiQ (UPF0313 family)